MDSKLNILLDIKEDKEGYVEVTQDGIARILRTTSDNIKGIYTENLQTCLAIIIVGDQTFSVIHATRALSVESVKDEFRRHEIRYWTFAYNPAFYPKKENDKNLLDHIGLFIESIQEVAKDTYLKRSENGMHIYEAVNGYVSIDRMGAINVDTKPVDIIPPKEKDIRCKINTVNNYFLSDNEFLDADIQYDGCNFSAVTKLKKDDNGIQLLLLEKRFSANSFTSTVIKWRTEVKKRCLSNDLQSNQKKSSEDLNTPHQFKGIFSQSNQPDEKLKQSLKNTYKLSDVSMLELEKGLRRAATITKPKHHADKISCFMKVGVDINAQSPSGGRTALHEAIEKNNIDFAHELLNKGARFDIPAIDPEKTAQEYAADLNRVEIINLFADINMIRNKIS